MTTIVVNGRAPVAIVQQTPGVGPPGAGQPWVILCGTNLTLARPDYDFVLWIVSGGFPVNALPTDLVARIDLTIT